MPVLDTCKSEEVAIKTEGAMSNMGLFEHSRASYSKMNCTIWPKLKLL